MRATICDVCRDELEGEAETHLGLETEYGSMTIELSDDKDFCQKCANAVMAKMCMAGHDKVKRPVRKRKGDEK
jgi:hypothetical protein